MADLRYNYTNPQLGTPVTKTPFNSTTRYTTPSICYYDGTDIRYVPLIPPTGSVDINGYRYSYDSSDPIYNKTIHCYYNDTEYVVPNKSEQIINYDFPAGTYVGQYAYNSIGSAISNNSYRTLKYDVTITHQGTTRTWPAGTRMYKTYAYSGNCINYVFIKSAIKPNTVGQCDLMGDNYHMWYANSGGTGYYNDDYATIQLKIHFGWATGIWSTIPFTVTPGIKFT